MTLFFINLPHNLLWAGQNKIAYEINNTLGINFFLITNVDGALGQRCTRARYRARVHSMVEWRTYY